MPPPRSKFTSNFNNPKDLAYGYNNQVPAINPDEDKELLYLISFLEHLLDVPDVRVRIREAFKLSYM